MHRRALFAFTALFPASTLRPRSDSEKPHSGMSPAAAATVAAAVVSALAKARRQRHPSLAPVDVVRELRHQFGVPFMDDVRVLSDDVVISFDRRMRVPRFVYERMTRETLVSGSTVDRKHSRFHGDVSVPEMFRVLPEDYVGSGFDRGHNAPAAAHSRRQRDVDATFSMVNMAPQVGEGFNRDYWARLEKWTRALVERGPTARVVHVFSGPLWLPLQDESGEWRVTYRTIGRNHSIAVPTHFFKCVFLEDDPTEGIKAGAAFVLPNAAVEPQTPLTAFEQPIRGVESAAGLELMPLRQAQSRLRSVCEMGDSVCVLPSEGWWAPKRNEELLIEPRDELTTNEAPAGATIGGTEN